MQTGEPQEPQPFAPPSHNELVSVSTIAPAAVEVDAFAKAAAHLQMFDKLRDIALRLTRPNDWHMFGDRPWPQRGACEKIMRALGLNLRIYREQGVPYTKKLAQDEKGAYYIVTVSGEIEGSWGKLEAMGFCSSRDQFFAREGTDENNQPIYKPLSQVNESDIIQAAYTNFVANAVMRYTGISSFTKEDLDKTYGVGTVSSHKYADNSGKKTEVTTAERSRNAHELAAICMIMGGGVESEAASICEALSQFKGKDGKMVAGKRSPRELTDGRLAATLNTARKQWDEFLNKAGDQKGFYADLLKQRIQGGKDGEGTE